ncbi:hypothetical protein ODS41_06970 [Pyrobaculum sp. 3827-6]|uniref:hypothetical protein n=1 Tax=Pyrobaculum sp. 3827-6 TaxID=2983604 RepID=UPI0021D9AB5C|nr:hypothetical protein [Pyrobaculum sp. 3827-6]MCU7787655.1 hypothetical protein [Pyrobaculum sp. 3827-6]
MRKIGISLLLTGLAAFLQAQCPMMGRWGRAGGVVNDTNVARYVEERTGYEVLSVEKYSNGYYVVVGLGGSPQYELLVFPNGVVHPEPQSVMWRGAPVRISEEQTRSIAQSWLSRYSPGA